MDSGTDRVPAQQQSTVKLHLALLSCPPPHPQNAYITFFNQCVSRTCRWPLVIVVHAKHYSVQQLGPLSA